VRRSAWVALALIAPVLAACGGDDSAPSDEMRTPPLTVPGDQTGTAETAPETDSTETEPQSTTDTTPLPAPDAPADQPSPDNGGVPAPDSNDPPADTPSNDTPPEPGSPADRFEQFCAQNPGAC
jgi:hypothetical protein